MWKVARLAEHLPPDSAVGRATKGQGWTVTDHLLISVLDLLSEANWQRAAAGQPRHKQPKHPAPFPRPGAEKPRTKVTAAALAAFNARH